MSKPGCTEEWTTGPGGTAFYTHWWAAADGKAPKAVVVAVHGFIEHVARFEHVFSVWAERGFAVLAYDQRGFGKTALDADKKSKGSAYGKFSGAEQIDDIEHFVNEAVKRVPAGTPVFLFGHSMGGGEVLSFATNVESPRADSVTRLLSGVIASSPLLAQTHPAPKWKRAIGGRLASWLPWTSFPAPVEPTHLARDKDVGAAFLKDPLIMQKASLRGLRDMLNRADYLTQKWYQNWPVELPVFIVHGDHDEIASCKASRAFYDKLTANDKTFCCYEGGYHELHNEPTEKDRVINECIAWAEKHLKRRGSSEEASSEAAETEPAPEPITAEEATVASKL